MTVRLTPSSALCSALAIAAASLAAVPAFAQTAPAPRPADRADPPEALGPSEQELEAGQRASAAEGSAIVVTGSRIPRPNLDSTVPITSVGPQELIDRGDVSLGDALNELPSLRSTYSQSNSTRFIGTAGLNLLDLRGLGVSRTLVLVNGRRHVTASPGSFVIDVNTIPADLLERTDIVTGGNSAIYGSDAVAGVANFILRKDFEGLRLRGQGGISERGDRGSYFASLTAGRNFAGGRGNIAVALEYVHQEQVLNTQREEITGAFSGQIGYFATQNTLGEPATGDGIPDTSFLRNVRSQQFSSGGGVIVACPTAAAAGESAAQFAARRALVCTGLTDPSGGQIPFVFHFAPDGRLLRNDASNGCVRDLRPFGSGNCVGGLGSTFNETGQLFPQLTRYSANLLGSFDVSPALDLFLEAKYVRVDSLQEISPTFQSGVLPTAIQRDNPFITPEARAVLNQILTPAATTFTMARNNVDFGGRGEEHLRETWRAVVGARGNITPNLRYETFFNFGRLDTFYITNGNVHLQRYRNAQDAVRDPATGQIVCRINLPTSPAATRDPACVPLDLFGEGRPSQAALDYVRETSFRNERATQYNAAGFLAGDTGAFFNLPGGPIGAALGVEWRREEARSVYDPIVSNPARLTFLNSFQPFLPPPLEIKEAFGEIRLPIARDLPFLRELTVEAAARISDYSAGPSEPTVAYNIGATWAPLRDLRFRGSYARSVRAPTLSDLFATESQTFAAISDPCSQTNINNNPNRVRNCADAGVPTTFTLPDGRVVPFVNVPTSTPAGAIRGNPTLLEEKSTSWTLGAVYIPRAIPGLSITLDYYDIEISDVIQSLLGPTVVNLCYDSPSGIDNQYCRAVFRRADGTFRGQAGINIGGVLVEYPASDIGPSFFQQGFNFARLATSGIDLDVAYRSRIADSVLLNLRGIVSWVRNRENFTDVTQPDFSTRLHGTLGDPVWAASLTANLDFGEFDLQYNFRYVGRQTIAAWNTQNPHQGRPPTNPDAFPEIFYPAITYSNLRLGFEPDRSRFRFYLGIDNVLDQMPPARSGLTGTGAGGAIYPITGRFFYAGADIRF
jgi:outer membrane receptor protein involved in Fe transport